MIAEVLLFLREHLDAHLRLAVEDTPEDPSEDKVVFLDGDKMDPIQFKAGAVTALLINVEEEKILRAAEPYVRRNAEGNVRRIKPDIRLSLHLLFVARFRRYDIAWMYLSKIVEHLQAVRAFDSDITPKLPTGVEKLIFELMTLSLADQNEVWSALRTTLHPSVLYRVDLVAFRDQGIVGPPEVSVIETEVRRMP